MTKKWLITYKYRLVSWKTEKSGGFWGLDEHGTKTEIIEMHPVSWLQEQYLQEAAVRGYRAGTFMTGIIVLFAMEGP